MDFGLWTNRKDLGLGACSLLGGTYRSAGEKQKDCSGYYGY
jgi:hypothetical protein